MPICATNEPWKTSDIPKLDGKNVLITGAAGGLGYWTALSLATAGATVLLGGRNEKKGKDALDKIKGAFPQAKISFVYIDNANLSSVADFAKDFNAKQEALDIIVCNAGVMAIPTRQTTVDGFELQLGTNHLSHFALVGQLLPSLKRSKSPRIVSVSSMAARSAGSVNFDDLNWEKSYSAWPAYNLSKLANLLFTFEMQKRSDENGWGLTALAAHPGLSDTDLVSNGPGTNLSGRIINCMKPFLWQSAEKGALPILYAATSPQAQKGGYYGPNGFFEMKGEVSESKVPVLAKDQAVSKRFWEESEKMTQVHWE